MNNLITNLFEIQHPIIQGGMAWCSGYELASAVSNAGGLGLLGAGSMSPETLLQQIQQTKKHTAKPFGVNLPLISKHIEQHLDIILQEKISIVFTSAGNPKLYTNMLKKAGVKIAHVVSSTKFALKAEEAGVDAIVAEGFEAGGHNGKNETTTLSLIPAIKKAISKPLIAAGGIATGNAMLAVMLLGADGVQIGTRFVCSEESSAHQAFKQAILATCEGDTKLLMKNHIPVRLIMNEFANKIQSAENKGVPKEELIKLLGKDKAKQGMFDGDIKNGKLEIGQISSIINKIQPAKEIISEIITQFQEAKSAINHDPKFK